MLIAQGRDAAFVADQLGHEDPAFTWRTYVHLFAGGGMRSGVRSTPEIDADQ